VIGGIFYVLPWMGSRTAGHRSGCRGVRSVDEGVGAVVGQAVMTLAAHNGPCAGLPLATLSHPWGPIFLRHPYLSEGGAAKAEDDPLRTWARCALIAPTAYTYNGQMNKYRQSREVSNRLTDTPEER
jgi:hypothetical protein